MSTKKGNKPISRNLILLFINILVFLGLTLSAGSTFTDWINIKAVLSLMTYDLLLACGLTIVLIGGGIDLSVGAIWALSSVIMALMLRSGVNIIFALFVGLIVALIIGFANGFLVDHFKFAPFLATLGIYYVARGIATVLTSGQYVSFPNVSEWFIKFGRAEIHLATLKSGMKVGVPVLLIVSFLVVVISSYLLKHWRPLNQLYLVGSNQKAAKQSGIKTHASIISSYMISAFMCWLVAVLMLSNTRIGYANYGVGAEMRAIAAAVVGGASMLGGAGSLLGTFLGVLMLALISNGFVLLNGSPNWQQAVYGMVLILAIAVDTFSRRKQRKA